MNPTQVISTVENIPVERLDLQRYAGKWFSLSSIPTSLDRKWKETTETYTLNENGYYNVLTTYKKNDDPEVKSIKSKLFVVEGTNNTELKAQFVWPFKVDYWVIELAEDYSYTVIGHPEQKYLFIKSRQPSIDKKLYDDIVERCKTRGYDTDKLVKQFTF